MMNWRAHGKLAAVLVGVGALGGCVGHDVDLLNQTEATGRNTVYARAGGGVPRTGEFRGA